jgi:polyisoprenoid-binding protein YceI
MQSFCLESNKYSTIAFKATSIEGDTAALKAGSGTGNVKLKGSLTIRDTTKTVTIPATYTAANGSVSMSGSYAFKWTDYNVPDPSIFISTLYPDMSVKFNVSMNAK